MNILILEDDWQRQNQFMLNADKYGVEKATIVRTAQGCIEELKKTKYDLIFLDHDLGGQVYVATSHKCTGSEVARWIRENPDHINKDTPVIIHSFNPVGAQYMLDNIPNSRYVLAAWTEEKFGALVQGLA